MPTTATAALIALIGLFPGILGNYVYRAIVGIDWREKEPKGILRLLGFSVVGLMIYALAAEVLSLPAPLHVLPETYKSLSSANPNFSRIFLPYGGHLLSGLLAGVLGAFGAILLSRLSSQTGYAGAWDSLVRTFAPGHWVIAALANGEIYAGKLRAAEISVPGAERDIVLEEPCAFDRDSGNYRSSSYQYLFIKAEALYSLAVITDPTRDGRTVPINNYLFPEGEENEPKEPLHRRRNQGMANTTTDRQSRQRHQRYRHRPHRPHRRRASECRSGEAKVSCPAGAFWLSTLIHHRRTNAWSAREDAALRLVVISWWIDRSPRSCGHLPIFKRSNLEQT